MKIQVFGSGCHSCQKLYELVQQVIAHENIAAEVEYITDIHQLLELGFVQAPALAIDGRPVLAGFVPNEKQLKEIITQS